jgi:hypothetical protein
MSGYYRDSNPFHPYDTRYKSELPQRTNALLPSQTSSYTPQTVSYSTMISNYQPSNNNTQNKAPIFISYGNKQ